MTTLLIDGDVVAYIAASAAQRLITEPRIDAFGYAWAFASLPEGKAIVDNHLARLKAGLGGTSMRIALSDRDNWRREVLPSYKANRTGLDRPLLLADLKDYLREGYGAESLPYLEADDVLGIWATNPEYVNHCDTCGDSGFTGPRDYGGVCSDCGGQSVYVQDAIVVGRDKDFKSIPGRHHFLGDYTSDRMRVTEVSEWEATRNHLIQSLAGDRIDGYAGCPGLGMERAAKIIDSPVRLVPKDGVITAGKNKGQPVTRWFQEPTDDYWACIVSHYRKAGMTEADALVTARVAKILHHEDYDMGTGRVTLWTPDRLLRR